MSRTVAGPLARGYAWLVVRLRFVVVLAWVAAAVAATLLLPALSRSGGPAVGDLVPEDTEAIRTEVESYRTFRFPVLSRIALVQHDPDGLPVDAQTRVFTRALEVVSGDSGVDGLLGALPVTNSLGLFPGSKGDSTTAITYLFFDPEVVIEDEVDRARAYAAREVSEPDDAYVGLTGAIPARVEQTGIILDALPWVEAGTVVVVVLILSLYFRSVGAPLVTLAAAAIAYLVSVRMVSWAGDRLDLALPRDLEPLIVVLLLGIITDYSIFFLSGYRERLEAGEGRIAAAIHTTADFAPIILTAGLIVAAGCAALMVATVGFLRAFGPGLAITVVVCLVVSVTFIPAMLAILGRSLYWPRRFEPVDGTTADAAPPSRFATVMTRRPVAALVVGLVTAMLLAAGAGLLRTDLGFTIVQGLPPGNEVRVAADAAAEGFAPGVLSPTEILLRGEGLGDRIDELNRLGEAVGEEPGVAGVLGPTEALAELGEGIMVSEDGSAARLVVILQADPLGDDAIGILGALRDRMPVLLEKAGLGGVRAGFAGDTALADEAIDRMLHDLLRIALAAFAIDLVLLIVFLRGIVAPLYLLMASVLGLAAALGLTTFLFQGVLGYDELTYYVPFGTAILLLSLGSDYNVFVAGRIWDEAKVRPFREAIAVAAPSASRTITIAGVVLAASFAVLAVVPLIEFREFAFAMSVGVLIDTFLVRSLLVPGLAALFGRASVWPSRRFHRVHGEQREPAPAEV